MIKKILIFLGLFTFILNLSSDVEAGRRGGIISSGVISAPDWAYRKLVTISSAMIPATAGTLTNFPVLVSWGTDTAIASHAQSDGDDIKFMTYDGAQMLNYERESYNSTSGKGVFWVNMPQLPPATQTIWMYYGNPNTGYLGNNNTWNSNYNAVWHLNETTGTVVKDSTLNNNNGSPINGVNLNVTGIVNGADSFDGVDDYISIPAGAINNLITGSIEAWVFPSTTQDAGYNNINGAFFAKQHDGVDSMAVIGFDAITLPAHISFHLSNAGGKLTGTTTVSANSWHYIVVTWNGTFWRIYVDGSLDISQANSNTLPNSLSPTLTAIGAWGGGGASFFSGTIDEVRVSNIERSAGWIATSYNNQSNPSAYITIGAEETL